MKHRSPDWSAAKVPPVVRALQRIGWRIKRQRGSHRTLAKDGWPDYTFAFHDSVEIGPAMLKKIGIKTGLKPTDL